MSARSRGRDSAWPCDVWDDDGRPIRGEKGELVCTKPLPLDADRASGTIPTRSKYRGRLFRALRQCLVPWRFSRNGPEQWRHDHPLAARTPRSTLGACASAPPEIYNQVEQMPEILESICIGQDWDGDTRRRAVRAAGRGREARCGTGKAHPCEDQERCQAPATSRRGSSRSPDNSTHQVGQDHRARRCATSSMAGRSRTKGGAGQSGGARPLRRPAAAAGMMFGKVNGWFSREFTSI